MSAVLKASKFQILDEIEVPQTVIENWQVTIDMLAEIASIPAALIMRVHAREIEVFLSSHSPGNVYHRGEKAPLDTGLYCETVMSTRRKLLVPDSLKDPNWDHNPDIKLGMISYCGLPLTWPNGEVFGTICILDKKDNTYTQKTHHLIERFRDSIQLSLAGIYAASLASSQKEAAESALRALEMRYRMVFEQSPAGILLIDPATGAAVDFNDTAASQLGYTREEFEGLRLSDYEAIETPEETQAHITRVLQGEREDFETRHRTKQGDIRNVLVTVQPIQVDGRPLLHSVFRDVTKIRRAEAELARHRERLEELVGERTAQLEAANKELEAFTYSVSHDLRAPLRAIEGFSRMLLDGYGERLDAEGQRLLGVVRANTARMAQLIDDLLAFSRIGRKPLETGAMDMAALARSAIEDILRDKPNPALRVEMGDLPPARGDRAMLGQVFANLIGNAVKYSGKKAAPIVEVGSSGEGGETVYFVKDNGAGFDMKYAGKLFGVFQRLHHDDEFEGTGVGLALAERIVRRHGGRIWAEGKVGEGAVFRFTLAAWGGKTS